MVEVETQGPFFPMILLNCFNPGAQPVDLNGFSLQYSSAAGSTWNSLILLSGNPTGQKIFACPTGRGIKRRALPSPDLTATINLSATSGKVALVNSINPLSGTCPVTALLLIFWAMERPVVPKGSLQARAAVRWRLFEKPGVV
jgi:hypothetical protein